MARIRAFDTMAIQYCQAGRMGGFLFVDAGQDAIPGATGRHFFNG